MQPIINLPKTTKNQSALAYTAQFILTFTGISTEQVNVQKTYEKWVQETQIKLGDKCPVLPLLKFHSSKSLIYSLCNWAAKYSRNYTIRIINLDGTIDCKTNQLIIVFNHLNQLSTELNNLGIQTNQIPLTNIKKFITTHHAKRKDEINAFRANNIMSKHIISV